METSASLSSRDCSATPRFGFHADPLAAFSGNRKRSIVELQDYHAPSNVMQFSPSHRGSWNPPMALPPHHPQFPSNYAHNLRMAPPPPPQLHSNYVHNQRMYLPQAPSYNSSPPGYPNQPNCFQPNLPYPNPGSRPMGRPMFDSRQSGGGYPSHRPGPNSGGGGYPSHRPGPNSGRGGYPSHRPGRGMAHEFVGHGMNPGQGRGNPARGGPPGPGQGNLVPRGPPGPERLYNKIMVEDPWKDCKPVMPKRLPPQASPSRATESPQSRLPKSISSSTTSVAEGSNMSGSGISLAASLAASLYETVNETDEIEQGTLEQLYR